MSLFMRQPEPKEERDYDAPASVSEYSEEDEARRFVRKEMTGKYSLIASWCITLAACCVGGLVILWQGVIYPTPAVLLWGPLIVIIDSSVLVGTVWFTLRVRRVKTR